MLPEEPEDLKQWPRTNLTHTPVAPVKPIRYLILGIDEGLRHPK